MGQNTFLNQLSDSVSPTWIHKTDSIQIKEKKKKTQGFPVIVNIHM